MNRVQGGRTETVGVRFAAWVCHKYLSVGCLGNEMMHGQTPGTVDFGSNQENLYACEERILDAFPRAKTIAIIIIIVTAMLPQEFRVH